MKKSDWKVRALKATEGTKLGAILYAAFGKEKPAPCFHGRASLTSDGYIMCDFTDSHGEYHYGAFVGSRDDLYRNLAGLMKHLKLDNHKELLDIVDKWIGVK